MSCAMGSRLKYMLEAFCFSNRLFQCKASIHSASWSEQYVFSSSTTKNSPENADFIQKRNFCNWKGQLLSQQLKIHIPAQ